MLLDKSYSTYLSADNFNKRIALLNFRATKSGHLNKFYQLDRKLSGSYPVDSAYTGFVQPGSDNLLA